MKWWFLMVAFCAIPSVMGLSYYRDQCFLLQNGTPCWNGTTGQIVITGAKIDYGDVLNTPPGGGEVLWQGNSTLVYLKSNPFGFYNVSTIPGFLLTESDPLWTANQSLYYLKSNPLSFYNASTIPGFVTTTNGSLLYANLTLYYLQTNPLGFYNSTNPPPVNEPLWSGNQSLYYLKSNPFSFYNTSTIPAYLLTESDPLWTANQSLYYLKSNPLSFYNSTTMPSSFDNIAIFINLSSGNQTKLQNASQLNIYNGAGIVVSMINNNLTITNTGVLVEVDPLWSGNQSLYYLKSNPLGFYNSSTIPAYLTSEALWQGNSTLVMFTSTFNTNPLSYYNASTPGTTLDPLWNGNSSVVVRNGTNVNFVVNVTTIDAATTNLTTLQVSENGNLYYTTLRAVQDSATVNGNWSADKASYYLKSNPLSFYNSTTLPSSFDNYAWFLNLSSGNQTKFTNATQLNLYAGSGIVLSMLNNNLTIANTGVLSELDPLWSGNATLYVLKTNPLGYYNASTAQTTVEALWHGNSTTVVKNGTNVNFVVNVTTIDAATTNLTTLQISENSNLYYTDARVGTAIQNSTIVRASTANCSSNTVFFGLTANSSGLFVNCVTDQTGGTSNPNAGWINGTTSVWLINNNTNVSIGDSGGLTPTLFVDNANDRVGVRTATPGAALEINGTNVTSLLITDNSNQTGIYTDAPLINLVNKNVSGNHSFSNNNYVRIDFSAYNQTLSTIRMASITSVFLNHSNQTTSYNGLLLFSTVQSGTMGEAMRIDNKGLVGINETTPSQALTVEGNINMSIASSNAGACLYLPGGGKLCGNNTCSWLSSPDGLTIMKVPNSGTGC